MSLRIDGRMAGIEVGARYDFHLRDGVMVTGELVRFYIDAAGHPTTLKIEAEAISETGSRRVDHFSDQDAPTLAIPWLSVTYAERLEV